MSEQPTPEAAEQQLLEQFSLTPAQELLALSLRHTIRQLYSQQQVIKDLGAVMAGETSVKDLLEERRYLLAISRAAAYKAINKNKHEHALPDSVCDDLLGQLEGINNDEEQ